MDAIKATVAIGAALALAWEARRRRSAEETGRRRRRAQVLVCLGLFAALCWWDLFHFHFRPYLHWWEFYHYYIAAKYFPELGYTRIYACTTVADAEAGYVDETRRRLIRDLTTNRLVRTHPILTDPSLCTRHFSPERWQMFKHDVGWFRSLAPPQMWTHMQGDFGYNGTPAWLVLGSLLANTGPASSTQIWLLALIDPAVLVGMWTFTWWAFGGPATCVALLWWGTNFPAFFGWTGGAYLRQDWLVALVVGVGLLYRRRWTGAGFALTISAALRVFPAFALGALGVKALLRMWTERRLFLAPEHRQVALGCALALAVMVPTSILVAGDWRAWPEFANDILKHSRSFTGNLTGLKAIMAYDHDTRAARTARLQLEEDPFQVWTEYRDRTLSERRLPLIVLTLGLALLVLAPVRAQAEWVVAVLGIGLTPILTAVSSYYYSCFLLFGLIGWVRPSIGMALCALAAATQAVPLLLLEFDERYTAISVLILAFVAFASVVVLKRPVVDMERTQQQPVSGPRKSSGRPAHQGPDTLVTVLPKE